MSWFDELLQDVRCGARVLLKRRGYAALAVVALGLGIGANTAIFSVINGVLLKPLPYEHGDRLAIVRQSAALSGRAQMGVAIAEYYDYREQAKVFDGLVEYHQMNFDLLNRGEPDRVDAASFPTTSSTFWALTRFWDGASSKPTMSRAPRRCSYSATGIGGRNLAPTRRLSDGYSR